MKQGFLECCDCRVWSDIPEDFNQKKHFGQCPICRRPMYLVHIGQAKDVGLRESAKVEAGLMSQRVTEMNKDIEAYFTKLGACKKGIEFVTQFDSLEAAWNAIDRADWLIWWAARTGQQENLIKVGISIALSVSKYRNYHPESIEIYLNQMIDHVDFPMLQYQMLIAIMNESLNAAVLIGNGYNTYSSAYDQQHTLNLQIARKHLHFPVKDSPDGTPNNTL